MSERKVLNKYYPPDFDPSKIPRMKLPKNRQYTVRLMAPFNMRCKTCGEYIYKGKKFNARKEDVENEDYLGIRIYRFYIKCTRCLQEISFKTDPRNTDYEIEAGATRNFMALKLAEEQALREEEEEKEEEQNNPMKLLENRTKQSKNEIELLESLEELKDLNRRQRAVDFDSMLLAYDTRLTAREREERMQQMDEDYIKTIKFDSNQKRKMVVEEEIVELDDSEPQSKQAKSDNGAASSSSSTSDPLIADTSEPVQTKPKFEQKEQSTKPSTITQSWGKSIGGLSRKKGLTGLVKTRPLLWLILERLGEHCVRLYANKQNSGFLQILPKKCHNIEGPDLSIILETVYKVSETIDFKITINKKSFAFTEYKKAFASSPVL